MNADGRALFAAICADPEDDTSRLVYADWLDENGDAPRAEALRASVERRRLPDWEPRAWVLDARLARLWGKYRKEWNAELPTLVGVRFVFGWSGLIESVRVKSSRAILEQEGAIFSAGPVVSAVVDLGTGEVPHDAGLLASCRSMSRIRSLVLEGRGGPEALGLPTLAGSPYFAHLRHLGSLVFAPQ